MVTTDTVEIVSFSPELGAAFSRLNREWLEKYFLVEAIDREVLSDPEASIIAKGGDILFARVGEDVVGTVALKHERGGRFELTKMAVTARSQGAGIGRALLRAAIARFESLGGSHLYLESHSSLVPALKLYESAGFEHVRRPAPSEYQRSNVYMVYRPN